MRLIIMFLVMVRWRNYSYYVSGESSFFFNDSLSLLKKLFLQKKTLNPILELLYLLPGYPYNNCLAFV
jgi:hypothetical protein